MKAKIIVDAGVLIAYLDKADRYNKWAIDIFKNIKPPIFTCEAVVVEAIHILGGRVGIIAQEKFFRLLIDGNIRCDFNFNNHIERVWTLMERYKNVPMDFADACIVVMSEQEKYANCEVLTVDRKDFSIYRRHGKSVIPIVAPEK